MRIRVEKVRVIVQATGGVSVAEGHAKAYGLVKKQLQSADGVAVELTAGQLRKLEQIPGLVITPDVQVHVNALSSNQMWPAASAAVLALGLAVLACAPGADDRGDRLRDREAARLRQPDQGGGEALELDQRVGW